ncbi:MAG: hypothetical protein M5U34_22495 [Chloroflexi bacterium]|nr:hypothetical protein [Chloroflexota bacterium]
MSEAATYLRRVKAAFENHGIRNKVQITEHVAFLLLPQVQDRWEEIRSLGGVSVEPLLMRQKRYNEALQLLDDSDDKASGYGHYYDPHVAD